MRRTPVLAVAMALTLLAGCSAEHAQILPSEAVVDLASPPALPALPEPPPPPEPVAIATPEPARLDVADASSPASEPPAFALEPVETLLPEIVLTDPDGAPLDDAVMATALATPGVSFATALSLGPLDVTLPDGRRGRLTVAGVDPAGFRVLVPQITADAPELWQRLTEEDLVLTPERAEDLALGLDDVVDTAAGPLAVRGIAALGQPAVASAVLDQGAARELGLGEPSTLLVAVEPQAWPDEVADALAGALGLESTLVYGKPQRRVADLPATTEWDRLAMCEASGDWAANTGNGYFGGLQFLPSSWHLVGGVGLPHEASRDEQIVRGQLLHARQGWRAWPVCSVRLGLRQPGPGEGRDGRPLRAVPAPALPPAPASGPPPDAAGEPPPGVTDDPEPPAQD
jgi:hypothetical protein